MTKFSLFIITIIAIKILFIILSISHLYCKVNKKNKDNNTKHKENCSKIEYWRERIEFVFLVMMSILLVYLFNPRKNHTYLIDYETKFLLFVFGIILLTKAPWELFIKESKWFVDLTEIV